MDSFRKAYGALKDSTKVGLAKVNSDFKDLDIAIVKATNHVECPPKERHVRKIFAAVSVHRPRADVAYCIHALSRRLAKTRNWIVAVKTLIVIHRTLREGDPSFREELIHYSQRGQLFPVSNFKDDSSTLAWDCSGWVRSYAHFLEERLECFRALNYDIETDRVTKSVRGISKAPSKTRVLNGDELLDQLPALQQLLFRLVGCQPEGAACHNFLIQFALALILKESFKIYCAINDGIINLVDTFFEMPKPDAVRALDIYKKAGRQAEHLADFYGFCRTLDLARTFHFPILKQAPASFLATMEEYIKEAPETKPVSNKKLEDQETEEEEPQKSEERPQEETKKQVEVVRGKGEIVNLIDDEPKSNTKEEIPPPVSTAQPVDLLSMDDVIPNQPALHDNNALALAIVEPANNPPTTHNALSEIGTATGWELALVTTPSNIDKPQVAQNKMAGGFDKLLLDSLYEDNTARKTLQLQSAGHQTSYGYEMPVQNPFDLRQDPFAMSNNVVPQTNMQMGFMSQHDQMAMMQYQRQMMMYQQQQQQMMMPHQQQNMMMPHYQYAAQYSQQQMPQMGAAPASNPFADSFNYPQNAMPPYGNHRIL